MWAWRAGRALPARAGSPDCRGIRDGERAGHSGQEGEIRDLLIFAGSPGRWPLPGAGFVALQGRDVRAWCCLRSSGRGRGRGWEALVAKEPPVEPGDPDLGSEAATGAGPPRDRP